MHSVRHARIWNILEWVFHHISLYVLRCEILSGLDGNTCFPNEAHASSGDGLTEARVSRQAPLTISLIWVPPWPGLIHLDGVTMAELSEPPKITGWLRKPYKYN